MPDIAINKKIAQRIKSMKGKTPSGGDLRDFARLVSKVTKKTSRPGKLFANCCECGRIVDTREHYEGGDDHGCELDSGKWVCSFDCWDIAVERDLPEKYVSEVRRDRQIEAIYELLRDVDAAVLEEAFAKFEDYAERDLGVLATRGSRPSVFSEGDEVYTFDLEINNDLFPDARAVKIPDITVTVQCAVQNDGERNRLAVEARIIMLPGEDCEQDLVVDEGKRTACDSYNPVITVSDVATDNAGPLEFEGRQDSEEASAPVKKKQLTVIWPNDCGRTALAALRYIAQHGRPTGGESLYNAVHLEMIASEVAVVQKCLETLKTADAWQVATLSHVTQALRQLSQDDLLPTPDYLINLADQLERLGATCISLKSPAQKIEVSQEKGPDGWMILPDDCWTHLGDFRNACEIALAKAKSDGHAADASYWQHQLDTIAKINKHVDAGLVNAKGVSTRERIRMIPEEFNGLYAPAGGWTMDEMRDHVHGSTLYKKGDAKLVWINEGDLRMFEALGLLQAANQKAEQ